MAQDPAKSNQKGNTVLKVSPYTLRETGVVTAAWGGTGRTLGTQFNDQGLIFDCGTGIGPAAISSPGGSLPAGLGFRPLDPPAAPWVTITFPAKASIIAISAVSVPSVAKTGGGALPGFEVDGASLQGTVSQTADGLFVLSVPGAGPGKHGDRGGTGRGQRDARAAAGCRIARRPRPGCRHVGQPDRPAGDHRGGGGRSGSRRADHS